MDFGKNLLKKYGWNEGEGLGKNGTGIIKPIKANLKFDKAGLGEDRSKEFNNHWWEQAFNEAASNINVSKNGDNVNIEVKHKNPNEGYSTKKLKPKQNGYNRFIKKSVLNGSNEIDERSDDTEAETICSMFRPLTDDELFAACGGLTGHKGSRFGLLSGKLNRIKQQEEELVSRFKLAEANLGGWNFVSLKKRKKHLKHEGDVEDSTSNKSIQADLYMNEYHIKSKKKRKKNKREDDQLSSALNCALGSVDGIHKDMLPKENIRRKKSQKVQTDFSVIGIKKPIKKKKASKSSILDMREYKLSRKDFLKSNNSVIAPTTEKKKKKSKKFANKSTMI